MRLPSPVSFPRFSPIFGLPVTALKPSSSEAALARRLPSRFSPGTQKPQAVLQAPALPCKETNTLEWGKAGKTQGVPVTL